MPGHDLPLLITAARAAGRIATGFVGGPLDSRDKPDGSGPVTAADLAVNAMLEQRLRSARPGYGWLSEESAEDHTRLNRARVFIVDPIDGTRCFIEGSDIWAHSLAVAEHGVITAAVVYLPLRDKLYSAVAGHGAQLNERTIRVTDRMDLSGAAVMAAGPSFAPRHWRDGAVPAVRRGFRPSLAYRLSLVAEGRFDAMLTLRPSWEWDIAAGDLILREAGALSTDRHARALRFNNRVPQVNGVLAANPALHAALYGALAP